MWYSNRMHFPFQEIYIEYAQFIARRTDSEGSSMQHQNMLSQDIRRWSSRIRTWSIEALEELEIRSRSTEVLMVSRWKHFKVKRQEDALHQAAMTLIYSNVVSTKIRSEASTRWQATLTKKR